MRYRKLVVVDVHTGFRTKTGYMMGSMTSFIEFSKSKTFVSTTALWNSKNMHAK